MLEEKKDESLSSEASTEQDDQKEEKVDSSTAEVKEEKVEETSNDEEEKIEEKQQDVKEKVEEQKPFHEHPRFKSLIREKNELKKKLSELEGKVTTGEKATQEKKIDIVLGKLKKLGWGDEHIAGVRELVQELMDEKVSPLSQKLRDDDLEKNIAGFASEHKDFVTYQPKMDEIFNSLSPTMKSAIISDPKKGLEFMYALAKNEDSFEKGKESAYKTQRSKKEGGKIGGGTTDEDTTSWSRERIKNLSDEEYDKHQSEIIKALNEGRITE